jgi:hypothetical protein
MVVYQGTVDIAAYLTFVYVHSIDMLKNIIITTDWFHTNMLQL